MSLLLRLDVTLLGDFLSLKKLAHGGKKQIELHVDLGENMKESKKLIDAATSSHRVFQQAEGNLFLAQLFALRRENGTEPTQAESLRQKRSRLHFPYKLMLTPIS